MSELKEQFQKARQAYQAISYDGNLAADVLNARSRVIVFRRAAMAAAMAAMILLAAIFWPASRETSGTQASGNSPMAAGVNDAIELPDASEQVEETFSLTLTGSAGLSAPSMTSITPASMMPTFSSMVVTDVPAITNVSRETETTSTTEKSL